MTIWDTLATPSAGTVADYRAAGWWRDSTFLDDLADAARDRPGHPAVIGYQGADLAKTLSYGELATMVERFASALRELDVQRGDVVVLYLPNLWLVAPLYLACHRIGAVSAPALPSLGRRELTQILEASGAKVCVTVDNFRDGEHAALLAEAAPDTLKHRVVVGDAAATGAIDFDEFFVRTPWEERQPVPEEDRLGPDEPAQLLFTSGTTGQRKAVAHSQNTIYAGVRAVSDPHGLTGDDVIAMSNSLTHMAGMCYAVYMPLFLGGSTVVLDLNMNMELLRDHVSAENVTWLYCAPGPLMLLLAAQREEARKTPNLKQIVAGSAPVQPQLVADVREAFDVPLYALWGMTENGAVTVTRPDDPEGWAAHSDGRSMPWMEIRIDAEPGEEMGRLLVRGASQCLGYVGQPEVYAASVDADGWFDTGDLARHDGRGGIRISGRRVDLITQASGGKISPLEVESVLQRHPRIAEVAVVGYPDPAMPGGDLVCAVVVADGTPVTLAEIHEHLAAEGMTKWLWPNRVQFVFFLPKDPLGKVRRQPLRERLEIAASPRR
jgi:cyclohexanecarboxylate-CoA ligase